MKTNNAWRKLSPSEFKRLLKEVIGMPEDHAEEYLVDPNTLPQNMRKALNQAIAEGK